MNNALKIGIVLGGLWFLFKDQISFGAAPAANGEATSGAANTQQPNNSASEQPAKVSGTWLAGFEQGVMAEFASQAAAGVTNGQYPNAWQWNWFFNRETGLEMPSPEDYGFQDPSVKTPFSTWWARLTFAFPQFAQGRS